MMFGIQRLQRGATLVVGMIFLLILTILGLAGMEISSLEEKMAGNMRDRNIAFQATEAALREGEIFAQNLVALPAILDGSQGVWAPAEGGVPRWQVVDWTDANQVQFYTGPGFGELAASSAFIVEPLTSQAQVDDSLELGGTSETQTFYRVTARAVGQTNTSVVILQSVYKR